MKKCRRCGDNKIETDFYKDKSTIDGLTRECKECRKSAERKYYHKHAEKRKILYKNRRLRNSNGEEITLERFQSMVQSQNNKCGICCSEMTRPYIDHNHATGNIRMLLCHHCNCLLGNSKEDISVLQSAIEYIQKFNQ